MARTELPLTRRPHGRALPRLLRAGHFLNAWMYVWAWQGRTWFDPVVIPEYFNVVGALLYR